MQVMDDCPDLGIVLFHIQDHIHCDRMLMWCVRNNMTGRNLLGWFKVDLESSFLQLLSTLQANIIGEFRPVMDTDLV